MFHLASRVNGAGHRLVKKKKANKITAILCFYTGTKTGALLSNLGKQ